MTSPKHTADSPFKVATQDDLDKLQELMNKIQVAMLTTHDSDRRLRSRPMIIKNDNFTGTVSFLTDITTAKIDEIKEDYDVNLSLSDPEKMIFVSLTGRGRANQDSARIQQLWSETDRLWFPNGPEDPDIAILDVIVDKAEYWDNNRLISAVYMAKDYIQGQAYQGEGAEHQKLKIAQ